MSIRTSFTHTRCACYLGYVTQAIVNNFVPLLLVTFNQTWDISLSRLALLVSVNFGIQLFIDLIGAAVVDRIGYRPCIVAAHLFAAAGMILLGMLPFVTPDPFTGILIAIAVYAVGGGLTEVLISPIVEACPTEHKEAQMSLLHSFYCWGHMFVIIASTVFFVCFGTARWPVMACLWAVIPLFNAVYFLLVPIRTLEEQDLDARMPLGKLLLRPEFWLLVVMMICAGASEQAMSQWASFFAEAGLGVGKTVGDLAGPLMFAALMGLARLVSARLTRRFDTNSMMLACCGLCLVSYLTASLSPWPVLSLVGCGLCGLSVGIMWPGTFSTAAVGCRGGGTAMFALLALAGDLGCSSGPWFVGFMMGLSADGSLRSEMLPAIIFPVLLAAGLLVFRAKARTNQTNKKESK
ncbi:MAG: MFS transporter [Clostridia bacterium]|nr:MFS transporter [Clostridia bacterium]